MVLWQASPKTWTGEIDLAPNAMYAHIQKAGIWVLT